MGISLTTFRFAPDPLTVLPAQVSHIAAADKIIGQLDHGDFQGLPFKIGLLQYCLSIRPVGTELPVALATQGMILLKSSQAYCIHWLDREWLFERLRANVDVLLVLQRQSGCWKLSVDLAGGVGFIAHFLSSYSTVCRNERVYAAAQHAENWLIKKEMDRLQGRALRRPVKSNPL